MTPGFINQHSKQIPDVRDHPSNISADTAYDAREIHQYNRKQGIKSNIRVNRRSRRHSKRGRPFRFDLEELIPKLPDIRGSMWICAV